MVIAILAVVLALAVPSFRALSGTMNIRSVAYDLASDLAFARSEAIKRNQPVTIMPVGGVWRNGWGITVGGIEIAARQATLREITVGNGPAGGLTFQQNGRLPDRADDNNLQFSIVSTVAGVQPRCVSITLTGATRSRTGECQ